MITTTRTTRTYRETKARNSLGSIEIKLDVFTVTVGEILSILVVIPAVYVSIVLLLGVMKVLIN
jgi:hypothetical protein